jgi:hypothetical protein
MSTIIQAYDIGCEPSPSVPAETIMQEGWANYVLFFAASKSSYATYEVVPEWLIRDNIEGIAGGVLAIDGGNLIEMLP